jgi:hypothetical protein
VTAASRNGIAASRRSISAMSSVGPKTAGSALGSAEQLMTLSLTRYQ